MKGLALVFAALALFTMACGEPASAELIAYEGFDYVDGANLNGMGGGIGWNTTWSLTSTGGTVTAAAPGMSFGGLPIEGNTALVTPTSGVTFLSRTFDAVNSGTLYLSMLANKTNDGTRFFGMNLQQNGTERAFFGHNSGVTNWSFNAAGVSTRQTGLSHNTPDPTLLVFAVDFDVNEYRLYVNPTPGGLEPIVPDAQASATLPTAINGIGLGAGFASGGWTTSTGWMDEIRIGTTWKSVTIPEPSGGLLLALGVLGVALMRRRGG